MKTYVTDRDRRRVEALVRARRGMRGTEEQLLRALSAALDRAVVVASVEIPPDVVTMNSRFRLDGREIDTEREHALVFPHEAEPCVGRISILTPAGIALLGRREGERITWMEGGRSRWRHITSVTYQPDAAKRLA